MQIKKNKKIKCLLAFVSVLSMLVCFVFPTNAAVFENVPFVNYFDVGVFARGEYGSQTLASEGASSSYTITTSAGYGGDGGILITAPFSLFCSAEIGDTMYLNMEVSNGSASNDGIVRGLWFYDMSITDAYWGAGTSRVITQEMLDSTFYIYGYNAKGGGVVDYDVVTTVLISVCVNKNNRYLPYEVYWELHSYTNSVYEEAKEFGYQEGSKEGYYEGFIIGYDAGYSDAGQEYYDNGYSEGHTKGYEEGYINGSLSAYEAGYEDGETKGFLNGFAEGYNKGETEGYTLGYDKGLDVGYATTPTGQADLVTGILDGLWTNVKGSWDILTGMQLPFTSLTLGGIVATVVVAAVVAWVLKMLRGK